MKKILIAIGLLVIVLGVAYVKTIRDRKQTASFYQQGKNEAQVEMKAQVDSLQTVIGEQEEEFSDSLIQIDTVYQTQIDSLEALIDSQQIELAALKTKAKANASKSKTVKTVTKEDRIIEYYKSRLKGLPEDLSEYERKIALNEIRQETIDKFSITADELKALRDKYHLSY